MTESMATASRIYEEVYGRIRRQAYTSMLPTDGELAREFGVNVKTVAKAIRLLAKEGVVERRRRFGTRLRTPLHEPRRPALNFLAIRDNIFHDTNPWRHGVQDFLMQLWEEAARHNIPLHLFPFVARETDLHQYRITGHTSDYAVFFAEQGVVATTHALLDAGFKPIVVGRDRDYLPELRDLPFLAITMRIEHAYGELVLHLKQRGYRRLGLVCSTGGKDKLRIFRAALDQAELPFDAKRAVVAPREAACASVVELLDRPSDMDALIVPDNIIAHFAAQELHRRHQRVPGGVALACIDGDLGDEAQRQHGFTHLQRDHSAMAREVANVISGNAYAPGTRYFDSTLIIRGSTCPRP